MQNLFLIGGFGLLGIYLRYGFDQLVTSKSEAFPFATFIINISGSFIAGLVYAISQRQQIPTQIQTVLLVGFCGGLTTFSSYSLQSLVLLEKGKIAPAAIYFLLSPTLGITAAYAPIFFIRKFYT